MCDGGSRRRRRSGSRPRTTSSRARPRSCSRARRWKNRAVVELEAHVVARFGRGAPGSSRAASPRSGPGANTRSPGRSSARTACDRLVRPVVLEPRVAPQEERAGGSDDAPRLSPTLIATFSPRRGSPGCRLSRLGPDRDRDEHHAREREPRGSRGSRVERARQRERRGRRCRSASDVGGPRRRRGTAIASEHVEAQRVRCRALASATPSPVPRTAGRRA